MSHIPDHFQIPFTPLPADEAVVEAANVRFTVLTSRLIRLEYSPDNTFEDRPSQAFWHRLQPVPEFEIVRQREQIEIITDHLHVRYLGQDDEVSVSGFTAANLSITLKESGTVWCCGDRDQENLLGTTRTLDQVSGPAELEPGLMSRSGWAVVDDSDSLVFNEQGWVEPRRATPGTRDLYFFGYGRDYQGCLRDYCRLAGKVPLLPRWLLGNWWSRYWAYTQDELQQIVADFRAHQVPLSVCVVDMDWHVVDVGHDVAGWTGYTWNRELFPEPEAFLRWLHEQGLKVALNLHPALGVRPHEEAYREMAQRLSVDPATGETIAFDIADPEFVRAYFEVLHHPQEERGVDFWWLDWQQGEESNLPGLDPLWWLNHLHFYDLGRDGQKRPIIFSRWGGLGNHRYPIGFSGDTHANWASLAFQPYFTATAANVAYGWWSHDIGGHMFGRGEAELYTRWVQFGLFSPILRLHSTKNPFQDRRPWAYDAETLRVTRQALQWRHAFIPYLYTMAWRNYQQDLPPIRPLYYDYSEREEAYHCPQQVAFGSELVAAPFTSPADRETGLSRQVVWLPPGDWYDFFSGRYFRGDGWYAIYGRLEDIPVFAKAGAIVPLGPKVGWGNVSNPVELDLHLFAGANGRFVLYEDDGEMTGYLRGEYGLTVFEQAWQENRLVLRIAAVSGEARHVPGQRAYRFHCHGIEEPEQVTVQIDGVDYGCDSMYQAKTETAQLSAVTLPPMAELTLTLTTSEDSLLSRRNRTQETCYQMLKAFRLDAAAKAAIARQLDELQQNPALLVDYAGPLSHSQMRALLEVTRQAGVHHIRHEYREELLLLWNNEDSADITYHFSVFRENEHGARRFQGEEGVLPHFRAIRPEQQWRLTADYDGLLTVVYGDE
jgi:alpha-glucosidase (family GH31 glycosyl hydrolase)